MSFSPSSRTAIWSSHALDLLRVVTALVFMAHGVQKLFGFPVPPQGGQPPLLSLFGAAGLIEFAGGLLVLLGLFTRPVAFLLAGQMAVAYWMVHAPRSFYPILNGGDAPILYCFVFLYIAAAGPGAWSMDGVLARRPAPAVPSPQHA